jgi:hypothetical protein
MRTFVRLYSNDKGEIERFIKTFYIASDEIFENLNFETLELEIKYENPVDMSDILGTFIENKDKYKINMWICIDKDVLINVTVNNANDIIKYLYERFPY